ncbi:MAG: endolytic transglycosylase MltG [Oceanococcaceae bacterium]
MRVVLLGLMLLLVTAGAASVFVVDGYQRSFELPRAWPADTRVRVESGQTLRTVLTRLAEFGGPPLPPELGLRLYLRWQPQWAALQAGIYDLRDGESPRDLLLRMRRGDVAQRTITVVEGRTAREVYADLRRARGVRDDLAVDDVAALAETFDVPWIEGRWLPESYVVNWDSRLSALLRRMQQAMASAVEEIWPLCQPPSCQLRTPEELVILASIIEKETGVAEERDIISGVFHRRLARGMRLQTDPTVIYGIGPDFNGDLTRADLRRDTPWNTYTRSGLPPTPICLPGRASLLAAAQPRAGDSLFFVSRGDGTHVFSRTLDEHNAAVRKYQLGQGS